MCRVTQKPSGVALHQCYVHSMLIECAVAPRPPRRRLLDVGADAVGDHLLHGDGADEVELLVESG